MTKKIFITIALIVAVILAAGYLIYSYSNSKIIQNAPAQESQEIGDIQLEIPENGIKGEAEPVNVEDSQKPFLFICMDKCGDGVCQTVNANCNNVNCPCPETSQDCPQDCKQ